MQMTRESITYTSVEIPKTLAGFMGWEFSSGPTTDVDFRVFARLFRARVKEELPERAEIVRVRTGHYNLSGFIERAGKFVYFSISDVRHFPRSWHENILVRTAKHDWDYTGGGNNYTTLEGFTDAVERLLH